MVLVLSLADHVAFDTILCDMAPVGGTGTCGRSL